MHTFPGPGSRPRRPLSAAVTRAVVAVAAVAFVAVALADSGPAAAEDDPPIGHVRTAWERPEFHRHRGAAMKMGDAYRRFLGANKTEREVVTATLGLARANGFRDLLAARRPPLRPGAKVYASVHDKIAALIVIGKRPLTDGVHLVAAHIDAVRIDLKQNPLYADANTALLQTHYYGGIKAYHWLSLPLELRGVVVKRTGQVIPIAIGDDPAEPVLVIPDIAVHLSHLVDHREGESIPGEYLDPIVSSTPAAAPPAGQDPFAAEAARLLEQLYGVTPADLSAAELELVPAGQPRDVGIDRALIGGYGQDDRACAYAAVRAILDVGAPDHTAVVMLVDKEEVDSEGNTGARSGFVRRVIAELVEGTGGTSTGLAVDRVLAASMVWSADVTGAVHPQYTGLYDAKNAAFLGAGVVWDKSAVHAEVMGYVRSLLDRAGVTHQAAMWGKSRLSGGTGATVLPFFTQHGMVGLDVSIPLLSMHAPFELISKADLYEGYRAYRAFLRD